MHKQDTATLDQHALARRIKELQFKQWWIARQISVTPLTVNRWLTGRVRRLSRDNLARLAELLQCAPHELVLTDETDVRATQVEQAAAAKLLIATESQAMFTRADQLETYERLIKAVMHPNLALQDLLEIYSVLTLISGLQGEFERSRNYARLKLDSAVRCGDADKELEARINLVTADGALGKLKDSHRGLLDSFSAAESHGARRGMILALINLVATYHLLGDAKAALRCVLRCLRQIRELAASDEAREQAAWIEKATAYVLFSASSVALEAGEFALTRALIAAQEPYRETTQLPLERETLSAMGLLISSLEGESIDRTRIDAISEQWPAFSLYSIGGSIIPAILLRRSGALAEAKTYLDSLAQHPGCQVYERAFIAQEQARLASAGGDSVEAQRWQREADALLTAMGMQRRIRSEATAEFTGPRRRPSKLASEIQALLAR